MKNKNILYLITMLITLFSFNLNVNAAQELTCVYENPEYNDKDGSSKIILIQYESGERAVYANATGREDIDIKQDGWEKYELSRIDIEAVSEEKKDSNGDLTACPPYGNLNLSADEHYAIFSEIHESGPSWEGRWAYEKLEEGGSYNKAHDLPYVDVVPFDANAGEWLSTIDGEKYTGSCKYQKKYDDGDIHTIVMNYGKEHVLFTEYDPDKGEYSGIRDTNAFDHNFRRYYKFSVGNVLLSEVLDTNDGECAPAIRVDRWQADDANYELDSKRYFTTIGSPDGVVYFLEDVRGKNPITQKKLSIDGHVEPDFIDPIEIKNCEQLLGEDISKYFDIVWNLIKIGIPILLIGLGTLDFAQAIFSGKEDDMKKVQGKFIKRIIIAVAIFLIPTILGLLLNIAHDVWGNIGTDICGILF